MFNFIFNVLNDAKLDKIIKEIKTMSNDVKALQDVIAALEAKTDEVDATLAGLAQAVVDLKNSQPADIQAELDALVVKAQAILDKQTAAEDAADDQLPSQVPPVEPGPV